VHLSAPPLTIVDAIAFYEASWRSFVSLREDVPKRTARSWEYLVRDDDCQAWSCAAVVTPAGTLPGLRDLLESHRGACGPSHRQSGTDLLPRSPAPGRRSQATGAPQALSPPA